MGNPKLKWTQEEEQALKAGVAKHGTGKWKVILDDPEFNPILAHRSNIDLKDKWRNIHVYAAQGSKETPNQPKEGAGTGAGSSVALPDVKNSAAASISTQDTPSGSAAAACSMGKTYTGWVFEALSTLDDADGSDLDAIHNYIQKGRDVPQHFRKSLTSSLRRLCKQGRLGKVENRYKIIKDVVPKTGTPNVKEIIEIKRVEAREIKAPDARREDVAEAKQEKTKPEKALVRKEVMVEQRSAPDPFKEPGIKAASLIAFAENASYDAAEAVKEAERLSELRDEAEYTLQWAFEIHNRCAKGEVVCLR